jgi:DNA-binding SARP family transcriptional activator/tetratricopeptide (TPR) repeat protein
MSPIPRIQLLGGFSFTRDDSVVEGLNAARLQSLIAYLVLHRGTPQLRQHLAFVLWPDSSEAQARNNLRQLLHTLRRALPGAGAFLAMDTRTLQWRRDVPLWLDVAEFEQACGTIERAEHTDQPPDGAAIRAAGEQLLALYQADLLPGCYDEWIEPERDRLRTRFLRALDQLIHWHEARREDVAAIGYARRLIHHDALNERAYRALMRLLARSGDRAGELLAYQACASTLRRELGIEPSPETQALHQRLLILEAPPAPRDEPSAAARAPLPPPPMASPSPPPSLVGRQREWQSLWQAWQVANEHGPGFVLVTGEAGIGKSRLAEEMAHWTGQQGATTATARSYAVEGRLSFAPVIEWLRSPRIRPHLEQLEAIWLSEVARVLPELLVEHPGLPHPEPLTEYGQRQRFFQALALAVLAAPQPLLLVMDDLQWCDQETLEWLHFLLRFDPAARLLVLGLARTEELPPQHPLRSLLLHLRHTTLVTEIAPPPLDAAETAELAARMLHHELDTPATMRLFGETEGNPLFVVEAVRAGLDDLLQREPTPAGAALSRPLAAHALPSGVRTVIAGRLAQLSAPARELAALAALVGREFSLDILTHVGHADEESIVRALDELWQRRIVREHGPATYDFTHDKLREVAQDELSAPQRHLWHRRIARALETLRADDLDPVSGQIAAHYEHGGVIERAMPYYQRAALVAQRVFAHEDAAQLLRHCLALLEHTPGGAARDKQELSLLLDLAPLYRITRGWTAPELERVVDRTLALCDTVGDDAQRAEALYGLQSLLIVQAQLARVQMVAEELHTLYERTQGTVSPLSDMMLAGARLHLGQISEANDAFERTHTPIPVTPTAQHLQDSQGWNFVVHTRAWQAHALWCLGYPDRAHRSGLEAVRLAQSLGQPFNLALAATYRALLSQISADAATARAHAEEALALTIEYKAPYYRTWAAILVSYAHARARPHTAHIAALRAAIEEFKASGARLRLPYYLSLLARIHARTGHPKAGLATLDDALAQSHESQECCWDAELYRLRGELLLAAGADPQSAEAALLQAAEIARGQHSRSLELRALVAIGQFHGARPPAEETRRALRDLYASFTEGWDTPDLQAARSLLARWGEPAGAVVPRRPTRKQT